MLRDAAILRLEPIGIFRGVLRPHFALPPQPGLPGSIDGIVELRPGSNYEAAVADLAGFSHVWLLFWFHQSVGWKPKVQPPLRTGKHGVFATRSPHRPNPLGLSCVRLIAVQGREISVSGADVVDGTPILDVKPYLPYADSHPEATTGWVDDALRNYQVEWDAVAARQRAWLRLRGCEVDALIDAALTIDPLPRRGHRVQDLAECAEGTRACFACRTWRVGFVRNDSAAWVRILWLASGHAPEVLAGAASQWDDVELHREFVREFPPPA
ncbi:MAG: tRNA (N6-threonylcarbamoyladenosine(37)-N6)-methyltransferase TrmO [Planctomycetota bacterium]